MSSVDKNQMKRILFVLTELLDQGMTHDLVRVVADETHGTLVPDVDATLRVDTEDRSVGSINQFRVLALLCDTTSNVLSDAHHTDHVALLVTTGGSVKKDLDTDSVLGDEGELKVSRLLTAHGLVQHRFYSAFVLLGNELLHQILANDFIHGVTNQFSGTLIPDIYSSVRVDTEDRGVGGINQFGVLAFLGQTS